MSRAATTIKPHRGLDPRVAAGTPEDIVKVKRSYTGQFLKPVLARARASREGRGGGQEAAE